MEVRLSERAWQGIRRDLPVALLVVVLLEVGFEVALTDDLPDHGDVVLPMPGWEARLLLLAGALALAFRRLAPVTVLVVTCLASLAYLGLGYRPAPLPLAVLVALFTVAIVRRPLVGGAAAGLYALALTAGFLTGAASLDDDQVYVYLVSVAGTAMLGYGVALSRARAALAEGQASELLREHEERTRIAVEQEQARIAREVHDIVAHDVSVIVAQAAAARRNSDRQPDGAREALTSIEAVGRDALDGLRRLMHLLRSDDGLHDRSPQPGIDRLPWLLTQVRHAGLPVDLTVRGRPRPLPATVELNAYRIVQEALTNSLKHAGPTRAEVVLDYGADTLHVEVRDHGSGPVAGDRPGYGLIGMQQRVSLLGGELAAAADDVEGFRVAARLPVTGGVG